MTAWARKASIGVGSPKSAVEVNWAPKNSSASIGFDTARLVEVLPVGGIDVHLPPAHD